MTRFSCRVRARPLESALLLAAIVHIAAATAVFVVRPHARLSHAAMLPDALDWLSTETEEESSPPATVEHALVPNGAAPIVLPRRDAPRNPPTPRIDSSLLPGAAAESDPAEPWSFQATVPALPKIDIFGKGIAIAPLPSVTASIEPPPSTRPTNRILRDPLDARDRALGLGSAGALVSAAHAAASPSLAPDVGTATLEIECDAAGHVVSARVLAASADATQWGAVARELVRLASSRTVRVPAGARGVRTRLRIVAERALPSGKKSTVTPGATPDDVPGGMDNKVCEGEGASRKCAAGMIVGATGNLVDVTNIGARASRIVRVLVLGEETM